MEENVRAKKSSKNTENVCRLCLRSGCHISIWDNECKYSYQIRLFCRVQLHKDDGLSEVICVECSATLTAMGYLREKSRESDNYLRRKRDFLNNKNAIVFFDNQEDLNGVSIKEEPETKEELNDINSIVNVEFHIEDVSDQENISFPRLPLEDSTSKDISKNKSDIKKRKHKRKIAVSKCKKESEEGKRLITNKQSKRLCLMCGKFLNTSGYKTHIEFHRRTDKNINTGLGFTKCYDSFHSAEKFKKDIEYNSIERMYSCNICDKKFKTRRYTIRHRNNTHLRYEATECKICHKVLKTKLGFKKHLESHTGYKPFECKICNKRFSAKHTLTNHLRSHTGEKPHKCHICDRSFRLRVVLVEHMRLHTGEKPYRCPECDKAFAQRSNMRSHIKYNHKDKVFK